MVGFVEVRYIFLVILVVVYLHPIRNLAYTDDVESNPMHAYAAVVLL